jgi:hypothetical protein
MAELKSRRRDILLYAKSFPPGPERTSNARSPCPCAAERRADFIPIPLSNVLPALVIAYTEEDGMLLSIALLAAVIVLTVAMAAVWEMAIGAKWIIGL